MGDWHYGWRMRRVAFFAVVVFVALAAAPADAAVPLRDCGSRAEGQGPIRRLARPGDLQLGPVAFAGLRRVADESDFEAFADKRRGRYVLKAPLFVRAGRFVSVSITPIQGGRAGLTFAPRASLRGVPRVRFAACERDEPAFSYDGTVGPVTAFAGGFSVSQPTCVAIRVRVRGDRTYSAAVPFGIGVCGRI
jgi:hypothetical protein